MSHYILTGTDELGRRRTKMLEASSGNEAVRLFEERGFHEIVLHFDEAEAYLFNPTVLKGGVTPAWYIALRRATPLKVYLLQIRWVYQRSLLFLLTAILIGGGICLYVADSLFLALFTLFACMATPPLLVLYANFNSPMRSLNRMLEHWSWGQWEEMYEELGVLESVIPLPNFEFFEARALVGMGRFESGLNRVQQFADDDDVPAWFYWSQLASIFDMAQKPNRVIECYDRALADMPENVTVLLGFAEELLGNQIDVPRGRALLKQADGLAIPETQKPTQLLAEGLSALADGDGELARSRITEALQLAERFEKANAIWALYADEIRAFLCLACAAVGDDASAVKLYRQAEPRLSCHVIEDGLLERCRQATGVS